MEAAIISPTGLLKRYSSRTYYHLCLVHLILEDEDYRDFYLKECDNGSFVILDNSVVELGRPVDVRDIIKAAVAIKPTEIVLPDWPGDARKTLDEAQHWAPRLRQQFPNTSLMVVPQGRTAEEWLESHEAMCKIEEVDAIGIGKFLKEVRPEVVAELEESRDTDRQYHLLGTWGNPIEVRRLAFDYPWVRGVDSKIPVRLGRRGIALHPDLGMLSSTRPEPLEFSDSVDPMPLITSHNVSVFIAWAQGVGEVLEFPHR